MITIDYPASSRSGVGFCEPVNDILEPRLGEYIKPTERFIRPAENTVDYISRDPHNAPSRYSVSFPIDFNTPGTRDNVIDLSLGMLMKSKVALRGAGCDSGTHGVSQGIGP